MPTKILFEFAMSAYFYATHACVFSWFEGLTLTKLIIIDTNTYVDSHRLITEGINRSIFNGISNFSFSYFEICFQYVWLSKKELNLNVA